MASGHHRFPPQSPQDYKWNHNNSQKFKNFDKQHRNSYNTWDSNAFGSQNSVSEQFYSTRIHAPSSPRAKFEQNSPLSYNRFHEMSAASSFKFCNYNSPPFFKRNEFKQNFPRSHNPFYRFPPPSTFSPIPAYNNNSHDSNNFSSYSNYNGDNQESNWNKRKYAFNSYSFIQKKAQKIDKRDLPENNRFFCDTCNRGYATEDLLVVHKRQHETCHYEGCQFEAAPKLVQFHIQSQHKTGLATKIPWFDTPSEIEKWREERKKNFPSKENVQKKKEVESEKIERGEVLEVKHFGKFKKPWQKSLRKRQRFSQNEFRKLQIKSQKEPEEKTSEDPLALCAKDMKDSDDEPEEVSSKTNSVVELGGVLGLLATAYAGEETEASDEVLKSDQGDNSINHQQPKMKEPWFTEELDELIKKKYQLLDIAKKSNQREDWASYRRHCHKASIELKRCQRNYNIQKKQNSSYKRQTLLEKLLAPDIRHERNVILQCIHYCIQNNFFKALPKQSKLNLGETRIQDSSQIENNQPQTENKNLTEIDIISLDKKENF